MKIGLTYEGSESSHSRYVKWLESATDVTVVRLSFEQNNLHELNECGGLVLSGGIDVHPSYYRSSNLNYPFGGEFDLDRDNFEKRCYEQAQENRIAVLGICRGLQFINCLLGGTLIQDLGSLNQTHRGNPDKIHPVRVEPGTLLEKIVDVSEGSVNSSHHQAIDKLGKGLTINCHAPDGTIEGIERTDRHAPFLLAVQWHPEDIPDLDSPFAKNILGHFIHASSR